MELSPVLKAWEVIPRTPESVLEVQFPGPCCSSHILDDGTDTRTFRLVTASAVGLNDRARGVKGDTSISSTTFKGFRGIIRTVGVDDRLSLEVDSGVLSIQDSKERKAWVRPCGREANTRGYRVPETGVITGAYQKLGETWNASRDGGGLQWGRQQGTSPRRWGFPLGRLAGVPPLPSQPRAGPSRARSSRPLRAARAPEPPGGSAARGAGCGRSGASRSPALPAGGPDPSGSDPAGPGRARESVCFPGPRAAGAPRLPEPGLRFLFPKTSPAGPGPSLGRFKHCRTSRGQPLRVPTMCWARMVQDEYEKGIVDFLGSAHACAVAWTLVWFLAPTAVPPEGRWATVEPELLLYSQVGLLSVWVAAVRRHAGVVGNSKLPLLRGHLGPGTCDVPPGPCEQVVFHMAHLSGRRLSAEEKGPRAPVGPQL
ncbi:PREDICTED: uncharacterized protein LOC109372173 [Hipposideros armiger]|uniref:Uncharacterized protein LOC109372173 n=1 Tax=Hipposideros armiger TaxID=186990 RepID=A0A8B7PWY4_HIPAR|nr:PREDICTED: uncharacterized protein LOC109372173 [Hipposideros armiger]